MSGGVRRWLFADQLGPHFLDDDQPVLFVEALSVLQYLLRNDKSGGEAVHKPSALKKFHSASVAVSPHQMHLMRRHSY